MLIFFLIFSSFTFTTNTYNANAKNNLLDNQLGFQKDNEIGKKFSKEDEAAPLQLIIARVIRIFLGFLGIIFLALIIVAGYKYMVAKGNSEEAQEALAQIKRGFIGLLIVLSAFSIAYFVVENLRKITTGSIW